MNTLNRTLLSALALSLFSCTALWAMKEEKEYHKKTASPLQPTQELKPKISQGYFEEVVEENQLPYNPTYESIMEKYTKILNERQPHQIPFSEKEYRAVLKVLGDRRGFLMCNDSVRQVETMVLNSRELNNTLKTAPIQVLENMFKAEPIQLLKELEQTLSKQTEMLKDSQNALLKASEQWRSAWTTLDIFVTYNKDRSKCKPSLTTRERWSLLTALDLDDLVLIDHNITHTNTIHTRRVSSLFQLDTLLSLLAPSSHPTETITNNVPRLIFGQHGNKSKVIGGNGTTCKKLDEIESFDESVSDDNSHTTKLLHYLNDKKISEQGDSNGPTRGIKVKTSPKSSLITHSYFSNLQENFSETQSKQESNGTTRGIKVKTNPKPSLNTHSYSSNLQESFSETQSKEESNGTTRGIKIKMNTESSLILSDSSISIESFDHDMTGSIEQNSKVRLMPVKNLHDTRHSNSSRSNDKNILEQKKSNETRMQNKNNELPLESFGIRRGTTGQLTKMFENLKL